MSPYKTLVIVGASFSGLCVLRELEGCKGLNVVLIEPKDYFEYIPGILRTFVYPDHSDKLLIPLSNTIKSATFIQGKVKGFNAKSVCVETHDGISATIPADFVVICTGHGYSHPVKASQDETSLLVRKHGLAKHAKELTVTKSILVIGGGLVGVELAAEVCSKYPKKKVTLITRSAALLPELPKRCQDVALMWLRRRRVEVLLEDEISANGSKHQYRTKKGMIIEAELCYNCTGPTPWGDTKILDEGKEVASTLRIIKSMNLKSDIAIYAAGDAINTGGSRTAFVAELQAELAAKNIQKLVQEPSGSNLHVYPNSLSGCSSVPSLYCVSLGPYDGIMVVNRLVFYGFFGGKLAALAKWFIESSKLLELQRNILAIYFWKFAHAMIFFVHRIIPN